MSKRKEDESMEEEEEEEEEEDEEDEEEEDEEDEEEEEDEEDEEIAKKASPAIQQSKNAKQNDDDDEFSFEDSGKAPSIPANNNINNNVNNNNKNGSSGNDNKKVTNQHHDEAFEVLASPVASPVHKAKDREIPQAPVKLSNQHYDEALDLDDDDQQVISPMGAPAKGNKQFQEKKLANAQHDLEMEVDDDEDEDVSSQESDTPKRPMAGLGGGRAADVETKRLTNATHDLSLDVHDEDEVSSNEGEEDDDQQQHQQQQNGMTSTAMAPGMQRQVQQIPATSKQQQARAAAAAKKATVGAKDEDEESSSEDEEDPIKGKRTDTDKGDYDPMEFANLNVSKEIKDLFKFIGAYRPQLTELDAKLKPFIPDYIPAVGDIDTFVKIPRPDSKPDNLGWTVLDEPATQQSNPSVVKIGLSYKSKSRSAKPSVFVESIEEAQKRPSLIEKWMSDIANVHRQKPSPMVHYTKPMPDVENLLQVWPADFEDLVSRHDISLPPGKIDLELHQYIQMVCALLDIPVYTNIIESLHILFTLFSEFKANQHFQNVPDISPPGTLHHHNSFEGKIWN